MILSYIDKREAKENTVYPLEKEINSIEDFMQVVAYDHVCGIFKDNQRKNANFIWADCCMFDVDNTDSDNPDDWVTPDDVKAAFPNVPFYISYSRNHMKQKEDKAPRPKFHIYFLDRIFSDREEYARHKQSVCNYFKPFDPNAKDAARFFFGVENPHVEYVKGDKLLYDFMQTVGQVDNKPVKGSMVVPPVDVIPEGQRNSTLIRYADKVLKRFGDGQAAYQRFSQETKKCSPPLAAQELDAIWTNATKFFHTTIERDPTYISPKDYTNSYHGTSVHKMFPLEITDYAAMTEITLTDSSRRKLSIHFARLLLQAFGVRIRLNDMNHCVEVRGLPPKYRGEDEYEILVTLIEDIARELSFRGATAPRIYDILNLIANENHYHPVIERLEKKTWDGIDRLSSIYEMLGITDEFYKSLVKKWAVQSIAVLYNSDEKPIAAQGVLVLQGAQGVGKTEFFKHLAIDDKFFKEGATMDMKEKDSIMSATKVWLCELGEIDSTTKKEQSSLKAFLTASVDRYREPYARREHVRMRRTSFCGTVNPRIYLYDSTGNRRYWTVHVDEINLDKVFSHSAEWYTEFWRQILQMYLSNPKSYLLTREEQDRVNHDNESYESDVYCEDEFMSAFDTNAPKESWKAYTAAEIAEKLNTKYPKLNITSVQIGKTLLPKIERRIGTEFPRKTIHGRKFIVCPPFCQEKSNSYGIPLPRSLERSHNDDIVMDDSDDIVEF